MNSFTSGRIRYVSPRKSPIPSATVSSPPRRCCKTDAFAPGGCEPCETCASWFGSPSSTTFRAAVPTASTSAKDTCPASSTKSVSTDWSSRENRNDVPATSCSSSSRRSSLSEEQSTNSSSYLLSGSSLHFFRPWNSKPCSSAASLTSRRNL